jgi:hypothetical protein
MNPMMSRWSSQALTMGRDGYHLARALALNLRTKSPARPILLDYARQSNTVATSFLKMDKEMGLMRYWGLSGYLRQRLQSTTALVASAATASSAEQSTSSKARIAFMVTASMKTELADKLGYDLDQIKKMKPLQASLILNHDVKPENMEVQLPVLEQEHAAREEEGRLRQEEEERQRQEEEERESQEEEERQRQQQEAERIFMENETKTLQEQAVSSDTIYPSAGFHTQFFVAEGGYASNNVLTDDNSKTSGFADAWFEVTETREDGTTSRVGLHLNEKEANVGMETRQSFADQKGLVNTFKVNRIQGNSL